MGLTVGQRQGRSPGAAADVPACDAQVFAQTNLPPETYGMAKQETSSNQYYQEEEDSSHQ